MGEYVELDGLRTWFDVEGEGDPVVLLHGGMCTGDTWASQLPALTPTYRVYVPERRGHGHTPDVEGPITYADMAVDTIAFLEQVVGAPAHLVGWSDGGILALFVSRARPDLVRRQVVMGSNFHVDGLHPAFLAGLGNDPMGPEMAIFRDPYAAVSPDGPDHWPVVHAKLERMWAEEPTLTLDDIARIPTPTLVLVGDDDLPLLAHTVSLYETLPKGQLAVVPGASHVVPLEKTDLVNRLIADFLAEEGDPVTFWPMRRAQG